MQCSLGHTIKVRHHAFRNKWIVNRIQGGVSQLVAVLERAIQHVKVARLWINGAWYCGGSEELRATHCQSHEWFRLAVSACRSYREWNMVPLLMYNTGPCITNVFATRRKNFSQWHRSFQRKLLSHWPKFLRHVAITLVIQGPGSTWKEQNTIYTVNRRERAHSILKYANFEPQLKNHRWPGPEKCINMV